MGAPRVARVGQALVYVALAPLAHVPGGADAVVTANAIHTLAAVKALGLLGERVGGGVAIIHVDLTVDTWNG